MPEHHHQCNAHELGKSPGDSEGQEGLVCCSPWGRKESHFRKEWATEQQHNYHIDISLGNLYMDLDHFSRVFPFDVFTFLS